MKLVTYDIWSDSYGKVAYCYTTDCDKYSPSDSTARANASLIAAAPELLEAAKAVVERWESPLWKEQEHTAVFINRLRAAIAKAEGEVTR